MQSNYNAVIIRKTLIILFKEGFKIRIYLFNVSMSLFGLLDN